MYVLQYTYHHGFEPNLRTEADVFARLGLYFVPPEVIIDVYTTPECMY